MPESSVRLKINDTMTTLVATLRNEGVNGIKFPDIAPECEDDWSDNYAIVENAYADTFMMDEAAEHYFDFAQLVYDFKQKVKAAFASDPTAIVGFHGEDDRGAREIEVYRKTDL